MPASRSRNSKKNRAGPVLTPGEREEDIDTLGGAVFSLIGRGPGRGEVIRHSASLEFEVTGADSRRIERLGMRNVPKAAPAPDEESREPGGDGPRGDG